MRLANAILHTYLGDEYKSLELEVPFRTVCSLFKLECNEHSVAYITRLINEILDEPVAVINKELDHKLIEWKTYDYFTLLKPVEMGGETIHLRINPEYLRIMKTFVMNPYLEF